MNRSPHPSRQTPSAPRDGDPRGAAIDLVAAAREVMIDNGFVPDESPEVAEQTRTARDPSFEGVLDLRHLLFSSIDNAESRDLDQVEVVIPGPAGTDKLLIGIADVDALVPRASPVDRHAAENTCSVYTGVRVFPMIPERYSTDLSSVNEGASRLSIVIEMTVNTAGEVAESTVYRAVVKNHAKLAYDDIAAWLEGGRAPAALLTVSGLEEQIRAQARIGGALRRLRYERGALDLETLEARPVAIGGKIIDLALTQQNQAREIIEDFMIAANGAMARFLDAQGSSSIRRVVKSPERWSRIVELAKAHGTALPEAPDARALASFLSAQKEQDRESFAELSLSVVKLMGPGEYALQRAGAPHLGHFGLAMQDYTHSTAPNRRYADLVTQRLLKATLSGAPPAYSDEELDVAAQRCTQKENDARKVERTTRKMGAAMFLSDRLGQEFDAIVTGATSRKGVFVRLLAPPAEGRVVSGEEGLDVGDRVRVRLVGTDPGRGFIDFARVDEGHPTR